MGAKSRYVPLLLRWPGGDTYRRLYKDFDYAGPLLWTNYLVACKLNDPEGQLEYVEEADGWHKLAMGGALQPGFTLADFFRVTGRLRKTVRRRVGDRTVIVCTRWSDHNTAWQSQKRDERRSRKEQENGRTSDGQSADNDRPNTREAEAEAEGREEPRAEQNGSKTTPRAADTPPALPDQHPEEPSPRDRLEALALRMNGTPERSPRGTVESILEVIPAEQIAENTRAVLAERVEQLAVNKVEHIREEVLAAGPEVRNKASYAVQIANRLTGGRS